MKKIPGILAILMILLLTNCTKEWDEHYVPVRESINVRLWDTLVSMDQFSEFVKYAEVFGLDTVIKSSNAKTLFIPDNDAFSSFFDGDTTGFDETMRYHIVPTLFMVRNVQDKYRLKTLEEKYALISNYNNQYAVDGIDILYSSPLFLDGKYYETDSVIIPKPNLYQYLKYNSPTIKAYIDSRDSITLDREKSKPIYFNDQGQTVYDSVIIVVNLFEEEYFAITEEYENIAATIVIPDQETYNEALNNMAGFLGGSYSSSEDIPTDWQENELIPIILDKGVYGGLLDPEYFNRSRIANINGDSISIDFEIDPASRYICSNGLVYNYNYFEVGDSLYRDRVFEAENFVESLGLGKFVWDNETVAVEGNQSMLPVEQAVRGTSNDTVVNVEFSSGYSGDYSVTFELKRIFPNDYRLVWRTNYRTSGLYAVYVNGNRIKLGLSNYDEFDTYKLTSGFFSVLGYKLYPDSRGFCSLDGWVNIEEYGDVNITLEYLGPGSSNDNGLNIDYIQLVSQ
ncbi:MAG: fasciclin domain-containing protein [Bacteroidales bacterium]|nr:fasciclin domain-containing protein [Bacteroidales bacterium]